MGDIADAIEVGCRCLRDGDISEDGPSAVVGDCSSIERDDVPVRDFWCFVSFLRRFTTSRTP
jgi:hypothetical protein